MSEELKDILEDLSLDELDDLYFSLGDYETRPVDIMTFVKDKRYLGSYWSDGLFPYWEEFLQKVYPSPFYSPYSIISIRGAIGLGKSTIAATGILYDLHKLLCLHSPQAFSNLVASEKIVFMIFNVTKALAEGVMWDKLTQMMQASPYFSQFFDVYKKKRKDETLFPKRIDFGIGSRIPDSLGKAVVGGALDELNFGIISDQMYENFNSLLRRMQSRFMDEGARMPARLWIISSETENQSVMNQIVDQYKNDPGVLVIQESFWAVQKHKYGDFPEKSFWVFVGSESRGPEIIQEGDQAFVKNPELCIRVPARHYGVFSADIHKSLRDLAGYSTGSSYKLFKMRDKLTAAASVTPIFKDTFQLSFANPEDQIQTHCSLPQYFTSKLVDKSKPRYIHIDVGLTQDRFGMASSYVKGFEEERYYDEVLMNEQVRSVPVVLTEWAFGIEPETGQEVPIYKAEAYIEWLRDQGFYIAQVSADGYQSKQLLQNLRVKGFVTAEVSPDKSAEPYMALRNSVYRGLSLLPDNKVMWREADNLMLLTKGVKKVWQVDHPEKNSDGSRGTKDIMDAVCISQSEARTGAFSSKGMADLVDNLEDSNDSFTEMFWPGKS